jgi:hypothetical protein
VTTDYAALLRALAAGRVEFIIERFMVPRAVSLEQLIHVKRAAGRVKDLEALAELETIAEEPRR